MQEHNTVILTHDQYELLIESKTLFDFFINILKQDSDSVFQLKKEALATCLSRVQSMIHEATNISPGLSVSPDLTHELYRTPWSGWYFKNGHLWDSAGNNYSSRDVELSWKAGVILDDKLGTESEIKSLKDKLLKKSSIDSIKSIQVVIDGQQCTFTRS